MRRLAATLLTIVFTGCATQAPSVRAVGGAPRHGARYKAGAIVVGAGVALAVGGAALALSSMTQHGCSIAQDDCSSAQLFENRFWAGFGISIAGDVAGALVGPALMISNAWQRPVEPR